MDYKTIIVSKKENVKYIQINRPYNKNTINGLLVNEIFRELLISESDKTKIIVFEGNSDYFCYGADFSINDSVDNSYDPAKLYDLWLKMATGPFITVSHVIGKTNAGGLGFIAASDIVLANESAVFSLSELLFGLYPAMVLPFLIRKIGRHKSNFLSLVTKPIGVIEAHQYGIIDDYRKASTVLLKQYISRLNKIPIKGLKEYKNYINSISIDLSINKDLATMANKNMFRNTENINRIQQFSKYGIYPWEVGEDEK